MGASDSPDADVHDMLAHVVGHLEHVLPSQASIKDFVHHNTLHGFQHLPFPEALAAAGRLTGASPWLPEAHYREFHANGRIDDGDIDDALDRLLPGWGIDGAEVLVDSPRIARRDVLRAGLVQPLAAVTLARLRWLIEECDALGRGDAALTAPARQRLFGDDAGPAAQTATLGALWAATLDALGLDHAFDHPESLFELAAREEEDGYATGADAQRRFAAQGRALWATLEQGVGVVETAGALVKSLTDEDALDAVRPALLRHLGAHLDQGLAPWRNPARTQGFYAAWRAAAGDDFSWALAALPEARAEIAQLPQDASDCVIGELTRLGLPPARWPGYLERLALELPGWSGMFLWRANRPGYAGTDDAPVAMVDYLAVRLVLERLVAGDIVRRHWGVAFNLPALGEHFARHPAELWVRHAFHGSSDGDGAGLPEWLLDLIEPHLPAAGDAALPAAPGLWEWLAEHIEAWRAAPTVASRARHSLARSAWPLFRLAQHLGMRADEMRALGRAGAERLLAALTQLDPDQRGFVWLNAYERHYREQILAGLAANHGRCVAAGPGRAPGPRAQLVFCMDDREEGMRRHLEEVAPHYETLGGAAHFAVFQNFWGIDDCAPTALCPVVPTVIVPAHDVHEVARADEEAVAAAHHRRNRRRMRWQDRLHQVTRTGLAGGTALVVLAAPLALAGLVLRALAPGWLGSVRRRLADRFDLPVATRLDHVAAAPHAAAPPATPENPRQGFTDEEQAERIAGYLIALGLTKGFAPLVIIMGHGSNSTNNPHLAAYDCGACAGRHSGPNARLFCAMANRPEVRTLMRARGIDIPDDTWFLGAEHNTADDRIHWYDVEDLPAALQAAFGELDAALGEAARSHAQERCRRLYSAPLGISRAAAYAHVWSRRNDWSQPRPELGHVTNACAFFGRRAMSRGVFFDRRAFLISYDPTQDADGRVLERHLLINGAVGAGINLEYFFSTVNNESFGCGSKVMHNVAGYFGVMQGAGSDLRTGLPKQMIEIHEAMRLLVVIEQKTDIITAVYERQPPLQELVGKGWVIVAAKDPDTGAIHLFDPTGGWLPWSGNVVLKTVKQSADWFAGKREALPPVLLERPLECPA